MALARLSLSLGVMLFSASCGCGSEVSAPPASPAQHSRVAEKPAPITTHSWRSAESSISAIDMKRHVEWLASDDLAGRETLKPAATKAAQYIAERFAEDGLETLPGRDSFRIDYTLDEDGWDPAATALSWKRGAVEKKLQPGVDFEPLQPTDEKAIEAKVVFAGYGLHLPKKGWDDYAGLDVKGKIVLVLRHIPDEKGAKERAEAAEKAKKEPGPKELSQMDGAFSAKAKVAMDHGAIGMIVVTEPSHEFDEELSLTAGLRVPPTPEEKVLAEKKKAELEAKIAAAGKPGKGKGGGKAKAGGPKDRLFVSAMMSRDAAEELVAPGGKSLADLQKAVEGGTRPAKLAIGDVRAALAVKATAEPRQVVAQNVIGFLPGSDPARRDQWVVLGGHYDHVGTSGLDGDRIHNGADDNASGTSGVLEIAQAFGSLPPDARPARSIVFIAFSGEEKGLLGSDALLAQKELPLDKLVFMLNLDMIGRNPEKKVEILGDAYATQVKEITETENADVKVDMEWSGKNYAPNSDHHSFFRRSVPSMFFFTGLHADYHQPGDHADKLAYDNMEKLARLGFRIVGRVAEADVTPSFIHQLTWLGTAIQIDEQQAGKPAVVSEVEAGSRGERAGLKVGDKVLAVGDTTVTGSRSLGEAFEALEPGTKTVLRIGRPDGEVSLEIERAQRGYLGVQPGEVGDDKRKALGLTEEEGMSIEDVVPGGPAAKAGFQVGDILITLAGQPVNQRTLFRALYRLGAGEKVIAVVGRRGQRHSLHLTLGEPPDR